MTTKKKRGKKRVTAYIVLNEGTFKYCCEKENSALDYRAMFGSDEWDVIPCSIIY